MAKIFKAFMLLLLIGVLALLAIIFVPVQKTAPLSTLPANHEASIALGKYMADASDCMACHTAEGGKPFAGGRPITTDMGVIWTTNITPDKETGIGDYTLDDFRAALYDGLRKDGKHLYPAMPYENYRKLSEEDVRAMYAYFMKEVTPVNNSVQESKLDFPFNQRWGLRVWNWVHLEKAGFTPPANANEQIKRGAYLVQGAGHCAACHSPRTYFMGQKGITEQDASFLTGGELDGWLAPDLRGATSATVQWSVEDMHDYLSTGRNAHSTATGEMVLVIRDSLQYLTKEDNTAIAVYLKSISDKSQEIVAKQTGPSETQLSLTKASPDMPLGARLYLDNCGGCHFVTGLGAPEVFPTLSGNSLVNAPNPKALIHLILYGAELPSTELRPAKLRMPGFDWRLSNEEVAELATFVRKAWGNDSGKVSPDEVAALRQN